MAEIGEDAVVRVKADTREAEKDLLRLRRAQGLRWPDVAALVALLGFVGFLIERFTG